MRRWVRIWSITDRGVLNATTRILPWPVGPARGATSPLCGRSAAHRWDATVGATHGMTQIRFDGCDLSPRLSTRAQAPRATVCNGNGQAGVAHPVVRDDRDDDRRREFRRSRPAAYRRLDRSSALSPSHSPERLHGHLSTGVPRALSWSGGAERRFNPYAGVWQITVAVRGTATYPRSRRLHRHRMESSCPINPRGPYLTS